MRRIGQAGINPGFLENFAWAALGLGAGTLVADLALWATAEYSKIVGNAEVPNWRALVLTFLIASFGIASLLAGGISLYHAWDKRKLQRSILDDIQEEMREMESRCLPVTTPPAPPQPAIAAPTQPSQPAAPNP
jgi:hypothetical protein